MYLHIGGDVIIPFKEVIGVFDMVTSNAQVTRDFLKISREEGFVASVMDGNPIKSFVVTDTKVYMSPIACSTLRRRWVHLDDSRE